MKGTSPRINRRKLRSIWGIGMIVLVYALVIFYFGKPILQFVTDSEGLRLWVHSNGFFSRLAMVGLVALQVVFSIVPVEVLKVGAGYAFGPLEGILCLLAGMWLGSFLISFFTRKYGIRLVEVFVSPEKISRLSFLNSEKRQTLFVFFSFLIPGTPKRTLSFFMGLTSMRALVFACLSTLARVPSVVISVYGGIALRTNNFPLLITVCCVSVLFTGVGFLLYHFVWKKHAQRQPSNQQPV